MTAPSVSVIVISRHRAEHLRLCLTALRLQDHANIEVIVVADPEGIAASNGFAVKSVTFDEPNIAQARNLGLALAAGEIVAFIDDDAVAEPTWASRLAAAFGQENVVAATGYTLGRNGISLQWGGQEVDVAGRDHPLPTGLETSFHQGTGQRAVKPVGVNCAFRRSALLAVGGFDPAYQFFLEDADIGLRIAANGQTAVVPGAVVHHAFAPSSRRKTDRTPLDLLQIGASAQVFLRRHAPKAVWPQALDALRLDQGARLARLLAARRITRTEAALLADTLEAGITAGAVRELADLQPIVSNPPDFLTFGNTGPRAGRVLSGRIWQKSCLMAKAAKAGGAGEIVTVICLSPTFRAHRMAFLPQGFWMQTGGLFGRSARSGPRVRLIRFGPRIAKETARIAAHRPVTA